MYSAVYKCVCKHQAERLYTDLMHHVESILKKWSHNLDQNRNSEVAYVHNFHDIITQFVSALGSIVPIFIYLVRLFSFFNFDFFKSLSSFLEPFLRGKQAQRQSGQPIPQPFCQTFVGCTRSPSSP